MGQWMDIWSLLGCFMYYLLVCFSFLGLCWDFSWFEGVHFPFIFIVLYFAFLETPWFQGVFLLLLGTLLCSRECWNFRRLCKLAQLGIIRGSPGVF